jgi:hypothetical protein
MNKPFSMNMGVYSQRIINTFNDFLMSRKNMNETECMKFKIDGVNYEDFIFNNDSTNIVLDNYNCLDNWESSFTGPTDYYNTGTMRIVEYYPNFDLYKIKANWGQGNWTLNS